MAIPEAGGGVGRRKGTTVNSLLGQRNVFVIRVDEKETSRERSTSQRWPQ